jgi:superfamily I DNA and/or RNA helicase
MSTAEPRIKKLPAAKHELLDKNAEGTIRNKEIAELQSLVVEAEQLIIANSKRAAESARDAR